jgi:hypothetical protein
MSNIPDSFNVDQLSELLATAKQEDEIHAESTNEKHHDPDKIMEVAFKAVEDTIAEIGDPIVHKAMMVIIIKKMIEWHTKMGMMYAKDGGNEQTTVAWLRDAGKFQSMADILFNICLGDEDFFIQD